MSCRVVEFLENPNDDFDGDGLTNAAEYVAGTVPTDSDSRFIVYLPPPVGGASPSLQWTSVAGKTYTIHKASDLSSGFTILQDNIPATPPLNTYTDPVPGTAAFYVISVR